MLLPKLLLCFFSLTITACDKGNDPAASTLSEVSVSDITHTRDTIATTLHFVLTVSPVSNKSITVDYATEEGSAKANTDFVPVAGTLSISPNTSTARVEVQITGRKLPAGEQQFKLRLSNAANASIKATDATARIVNPGFGYTLVWSDEFDSTALNANNWNYETGANGWGNNELENYTAGTNNAYIENGNLVIEAKKEISGSAGYSSARLTSKGKQKFSHGKIEFRAKLPATKGIWPALWMLGENIDQVGWPTCGEIDIMELINKEQPSKIYGTGHWAANGGHASAGGNFTLSSGYYSDAFHLFAIEWDGNQIKWLMDNNQYYQLNRADVTGDSYPFDKEFYLIMNVAVGGNWPGNPDASSVFPQKMLVDYVRVYQQ